MLQYSISLWSFNPLLHSGDMSTKAAMRFARSVGFQGIEMLDLYWKAGEDRMEQARKVRKDAAEEAVEIACYTVHNNLAIFEDGPWKALVDRMLADVDLARALGTKTMRVESSFGPAAPYDKKSFDECLVPIAKGLKAVSRKAAEAGIAVGLENHGRFIGSSERVERVIDAVDEKNFGACVDIGNFLVVDEESIPAVRQLAPKAVHAHVKDMHLFDSDPGEGAFATNGGRFLRGAILGEGVVDVSKCVDLLVKAGYAGWLSLEFEGRENLFYAIRRSYKNLSEAVKRLSLRA